ncbi:PREDICTED: inhibitor of Bruton tyrosine kinase-like [Priapulus caudatus]|uniref:Inhibitor of Bruton tyrosine kinase-like n=1 Tax=Priapulus caudatus TaxID=37621 RepID=A0ABM1E0B1_PRICU|nr:PREDICTED: inhibitor of Bruton tyrosine kinase-like [Priapulus caudatus]
MKMSFPLPRECTTKCRSEEHASELITTVTSRAATVDQLKAYCLQRCANFAHVRDELGRTVLHMAAACGQTELVSWLLEDAHCDVQLMDYESRWNALHKALFYGQLSVARTLIMHGASLTACADYDGFNPLDIVVKDRRIPDQFSSSDPGDLYTWGDNANFTLGHSDGKSKHYPEMVVEFKKHSLSIKQVVMCEFHSVVLTHCGRVYTCGHGRGGRLGHDAMTCLMPRQVVGMDNVMYVAAGLNHTVMLTDAGSVWTCGLATAHSLSTTSPRSEEASFSPKMLGAKIMKTLCIVGICAGRFHTVLWTAGSVFTFGVNAGQLGHARTSELIISQPRLVAALDHKDIIPKLVSCCEGATVCVTTKGDVYVLHEYQTRKIASKHVDAVRVTAYGGHLDCGGKIEGLNERGGHELRILLLSSTNKLYSWRASDPIMRRVLFTSYRSALFTEVALHRHGAIMATSDGEVFLATFKKRGPTVKEKEVVSSKEKSREWDTFVYRGMAELLNIEDCEVALLQRVSGVHRATAVSCDPSGRNFAAVQSDPNTSMTEVPCVEASTMWQNLKQLYDETDSFDNIHDVCIKVLQRSFYAHAYILSSRSEFFRKALDCGSEQPGTHHVEVDGIHPDIFAEILTYMYTDTCHPLQPGSKFQLQHLEGVTGNVLSMSDTGQEPHCGDFLDLHGQKVEHLPKKAKKGQRVLADGDGHHIKGKVDSNPIMLLQEAARRLGIFNLAKRLEGVKHISGRVQSTGKMVHCKDFTFSRNQFPELHDVTLQAQDDSTISCHKCVLVARLEYFHSMLTSGWIEASQETPLKLPVASKVLHCIVDYLYTDSATSLMGTEDTEFVCSVLVAADQLLMGRLRSLAEIALSLQVSLRNVGEILELSYVYNAPQLQCYCQQFICLNLPSVLEGRTLDVCSNDVVDRLTDHYRQTVQAMSHRVITPFYNTPDFSQLDTSFTLVTPLADNGMPNDSAASQRVKQRKKSRGAKSRSVSESKETLAGGDRQRLESVCSIVSVDEDYNVEDPLSSPNDSFHDDDLPQKQEDIRSLAGVLNDSAHGQEVKNQESLQQPPPAQGYYSQPSKDPLPQSLHIQGSYSQWGAVSPQSPPSSGIISLRDIMDEEQHQIVKAKRLPRIKKPFQKVQLSPQNHNHGNQTNCNREDAAAVSTGNMQQPWTGGLTKVVSSFRDLMLEEEKCSQPLTPAKHHTRLTQRSTPGKAVERKISWDVTTSNTRPSDPATSNPWSGAGELQQGSKPVPVTSFNEIVLDEIESHAELTKISKKPLTAIQVEEQAMQELLLHYNSMHSYDELITVERVQRRNIARPLWTKHPVTHGGAI